MTDLTNQKLIDLIRRSHDMMDEYNNSHPEVTETWGIPICHWCGSFGIDQNGIAHKDDCILLEMRKILV